MATRRKSQRSALVRDAVRPSGGPGGEIVLYEAPNGTVSLNVRLDRESIWLNQAQLSALLGRDPSVISRHLRNLFKEKELDRASVVAFFASTASDGKTYNVEYFNLDVVISVGYRVHSKRGTQFRVWATRVLRDHLLKGYSVNQRRLRDLNQAVRLISDVAKRRGLSGDEASALLEVVGEYSHALDLLDDYDHQRVTAPVLGGKTVHIVGHDYRQGSAESPTRRWWP